MIRLLITYLEDLGDFGRGRFRSTVIFGVLSTQNLEAVGLLQAPYDAVASSRPNMTVHSGGAGLIQGFTGLWAWST